METPVLQVKNKKDRPPLHAPSTSTSPFRACLPAGRPFTLVKQDCNSCAFPCTSKHSFPVPARNSCTTCKQQQGGIGKSVRLLFEGTTIFSVTRFHTAPPVRKTKKNTFLHFTLYIYLSKVRFLRKQSTTSTDQNHYTAERNLILVRKIPSRLVR